MSKKVTIEAYEFHELSDAAKEKARAWWREASAGDSWWSESTIEEANEQAKLMGITIDPVNQKWRSADGKRSGVDMSPRIYWRGFWSQGDGACFEGTWRASDVQADKVADGWGDDPATTEIKRIAAEFDRIAKAYPHSSFSVKHRGRYYHEHCTEFDFQFPDDNEGEDWPESKREEWDKECDALKEAAKDFMRWIYRQLEKEYEYHDSDEQIDETIMANEYLFTAEGKRMAVL